MVPEVEYTRDDLVSEIKAGIAKGKKHAIVAITEHMCDVDELAHYIEKETGRETRATVLGHIQRGGSPVPYDRVLSTRLGARAAQLIIQEEYGYMVGIINGETCKVPLGEVAGKLKMVDPNSGIIEEAKMIGISFGD